MHSLLCRFAQGCVNKEIISCEELDWLVYGLEKRITTAIVAIAFFLIGLKVAAMPTVISFLLCFYFLRVRTNGYHANSFIGCLMFSLILELFFLVVLLPLLKSSMLVCLNILSLVIIFVFAPFTSENMHLDKEEFAASRKTSRIRISLLSGIATILYALGVAEIGKGITLGNTMTALLLIIAYIKEKGESKNEKRKQHL